MEKPAFLFNQTLFASFFHACVGWMSRSGIKLFNKALCSGVSFYTNANKAVF